MVAVHLPFVVSCVIWICFSVTPSSSLTDEEALLAFKKTMKITKGDLNSWRPGTSPCKDRWWGVYCNDDGSITGIHIARLGLSGSIDIQSLSGLAGLRTIRLDNNSLSGTIPEFNKLTQIRSLLISNNGLSGEIANDFFTPMENLRRLFMDSNQFTGSIPESLMQLSYLEELHLQGNGFSGKIPPLKAGVPLKTLDLSNNKLEGEIPSSLASFGAAAFEGNAKLCGKPLANECSGDEGQLSDDGSGSDSELPKDDQNSHSRAVGISIAVCLFLFLLIVIITARRRKQEPEFSVLDKDHLSDTEVVGVRVPESVKKTAGSIRGGDASRKGSHHGKGGAVGDLVMVNEEKGVFGLPDLMKAAAEVLGNGNLGSAYKAVMAGGLAVVVKRIREMNKMGRDAFEVEMRRFAKLNHPNVIIPLAYHYRREEKLLVSEYMPKGSLLYVLHGDRGIQHSELTWPTRLRIIQGVARGMSFLHEEFATYALPHGNLKSSNVLLNENYEPLLSDYAFLPLLNPNNAPQLLFGYKAPEYTEQQQVSPKSDVYCLGIVILEIITGKFPSQYLNNSKGGTDVVQWAQSAVTEQKEEDVIDPETSGDTDSIQQMVQVLRIGTACVESNPETRLDMREAVRRIEEVQA